MSWFDELLLEYEKNVLVRPYQLDESAPEGWEGTVKAMKGHKDVSNPWALAHWMKKKGYKSHKKNGSEEMTEEGKKKTKTKYATMKDKPKDYLGGQKFVG